MNGMFFLVVTKWKVYGQKWEFGTPLALIYKALNLHRRWSSTCCILYQHIRKASLQPRFGAYGRGEMTRYGKPKIQHQRSLVSTNLALHFLHEWRSVRHHPSKQVANSDSQNVVLTWKKPQHGIVKLNINASIFIEQGLFGACLVLCGGEGNFYCNKNHEGIRNNKAKRSQGLSITPSS